MSAPSIRVTKEPSPSAPHGRLYRAQLYSLIRQQNQLAKESINARPSRFTRGDRVDSMIIEKNNSKKTITLSIKALEEKQSKDVLKKYGSEASGGVLGELLGPLIKKKKSKK